MEAGEELNFARAGNALHALHALHASIYERHRIPFHGASLVVRARRIDFYRVGVHLGQLNYFARSAKKNEEAFILLISERILRYNIAVVSLQDLLAPLGWRFGSCLLSRVCRGGERLHD